MVTPCPLADTVERGTEHFSLALCVCTTPPFVREYFPACSPQGRGPNLGSSQGNVRYLSSALRAGAETNPAQSCPWALFWLKERKFPCQCPCSACHAGMSQVFMEKWLREGAGWLLDGKANSAQPRRSKVLGKSHRKQGIHALVCCMLSPSELCL